MISQPVWHLHEIHEIKNDWVKAVTSSINNLEQWQLAVDGKIIPSLPISFEQKVDLLIHLFQEAAPKLELLAKVYGAMNILEEDKK